MTLDEFFGIGVTVMLGSHKFEPEAIKAFARKYDPQPFHVDEEAAKKSVFGRLCASGWHTASTWMKYNLATRMETEGKRWTGPGPIAGLRTLARLQESEMAETGLCRRDDHLHPHRCRPSPDRLTAGLATAQHSRRSSRFYR